MSDCPPLDVLLELPSDRSANAAATDLATHLATCPACARAADEVHAVRRFTRELPANAWGAGPLVEVDVEAALAAVLARADAPHRLPVNRLLPWASSVAAALLLFSLVAPAFLRARVEGTLEARAAGGGAPGSVVFWTSSVH